MFILEICPYHLILLFRTVFSAISCPVLTRTSALHTLSVYLMRSIRRSRRFSHAFSLFSMAVVKLQVSLPYSRIGITAAFSSLIFIACYLLAFCLLFLLLISCLLKTFPIICEMLLLQDLQELCASSRRPLTHPRCITDYQDIPNFQPLQYCYCSPQPIVEVQISCYRHNFSLWEVKF